MRLQHHRFFTIVFLFVPGLLFSQTMKETSSKPSESLATSAQLRTAVSEAIQEDPSIIQFHCEKVGEKYYYNLRSIEETLPGLAIGRAIRTQLTVEMLKARPKAEIAKIWNPYIARLEKAVDAEMGGLRTDSISTKAPEAFSSDVRKTIEEMFAQYARMNGATEGAINGVPVKPDAKPTIRGEPGLGSLEKAHTKGYFQSIVRQTVSVKTSPPGGDVYFLPPFDYWFLKKNGKVDDLQQWRELVGGKASLTGSYIFQVRYSPTKFFITGKIRIDGEQEIVLSQNDKENT